MGHKFRVVEKICGDLVESLIESFREGDYYKVRIESPCPMVKLFSKKIMEMKWEKNEIYHLSLNEIWSMAKGFGLKPFCPIPTIVMNAIWLEAGLISESVALNSKTTIRAKKADKTQLEVDLPICGYKAFINAESNPAKKVKISVTIPCPDVNKFLKGIENKPFRDLEMCDEVYRLSKITDEKTCLIPVSVCIAYSIESKKIDVGSSDLIVEIQALK